EEPREQQPVADRVDASGYAAAALEDRLEGAGDKLRIALPADALEAVLDVTVRLLEVPRSDVTCADYPLAKLRHFGALHRAPEFRLPDEEALQQRVRLELEVRQHPQLFDGPRREVLRLVDDEQRALPLLAHRDEKRFQRQQQVGFLDAFGLQSE